MLAALALVAGCDRDGGRRGSPSPVETSSPPPTPPRPEPPGPKVVTVVAAGDIVRSEERAERTADLVESLDPQYVLTLGDNAYPEGSRRDYDGRYDRTWGAFKERTRPVPGNHEYGTDDAAGYFGYFRDQVRDRRYYAWNAGAWRFYALNCEIDCEEGSVQEEWLRKDVAAHRDRPSVAYVHRPLYSCSTVHEPYEELAAIWEALMAGNGQLMLAGHNHAYERFAPMDADEQRSPDGLRQFVVGTGGARLYPLESPCTGREAENDTTTGVLRLLLRPDSYAWEFVGVDGDVHDAGEQEIDRR